MSQNKALIYMAIGFIICSAAFNAFGSYTTKFTSAASRTVVEQSRVIFVWTFFLAYQGVGNEKFSSYKLIGFSLIVFGVLFFLFVQYVFKGCIWFYLNTLGLEGFWKVETG